MSGQPEEQKNQDLTPKQLKRGELVTQDCVGCQEQFNEEEIGIKCEGNDFMCAKNECAANFIKEWLEEPKYPLKCFCNNNIHQNTFEMCIKPEQLEQYLNICAAYSKQEDEELIKCPACGYFEYSPIESQEIFFFCQKENCSSLSCMICHKTLNKLEENYEIDTQKEFDEHLYNCDPFRHIKRRWDDIINQGQQQFCPGCGLGGMKNNACNKIICYKCQTIWCYYCSLPSDKFDKDGDNDYSHFENFQTDYNNRCPLYLEELHEYNEKYPKDGMDCLRLIHRTKTLKLLKKFVDEIGVDQYKELCLTFPQCGDASGYTLDQILQADFSFIKNTVA